MNTDFYMTTEHRRRDKKGRVRFSMVMNKVLVGTIVLATLVNPLSTVHAAAPQKDVPKANHTVEMQYEQSIENIKFKINNTISQLETMKVEENRVSKALIKEMASGLLELESAIRTSGAEVTEDVFAILDRAENSLKGVPDTFKEVQDAKKAIERVRISIGVKETITEKNKDAAVNLSDISSHWGKKYIDNLVARGGISGYPDGTFKPNNNITRAEFMAIAVKSALNGQVANQVDNHWASGVFQTAREKQVLLLNDFPKSDWDKPITRYEMSYVMVRVTENILSEGRTSAAGVENIMSDYKEVSGQQKYKYYVEQAFMKGLVSGKTSDGLYDGKANGTRAEAATMVVRMLDKSIREKVDINKPFEGTKAAKAVFDQIPTYNQKTDHGLVFGDKGYTLDDVATFSKSYLSTSWNYDGTNKADMDKWEKEVFKYVTTGSQADVTKNKQKFIDTKDICKSDIYVDASKIEIKNGNFIVHAVAYDHVTGKTFNVDVTIGGHNVNKSEIAVGLWKINEVK